MIGEVPLVDGRFRALGSDCRIAIDLDENTLHQSIHRIEDLEARWSRFREDSEVAHLNRSAGEWVDLSSITIDLLDRAQRAATATGGRFDALMLRDLEAIGYDRSFELLADSASAPAAPTRAPNASSIEIEGGMARIPAGSAFDPGGLGKGVAADLVLDDLLDAGARWAIVSLGGDIRFGGEILAELGSGLVIENPLSMGTEWGRSTVDSGAIATSSTRGRSWVAGDTTRHHLLDPRTRLPSDGPRIAATAHAQEAWWADVIAKCVVIDPMVDTDDLDDWSASALTFHTDGSTELLGSTDSPLHRAAST
ncbi:MAG: FAD:protein FMN transferase [Acidimicrobiales bacterium]